GISRPSAATVLRFGAINLGEEAAHCTASGFRSDGTAAGAPRSFTLPALAQGAVPSPLSFLGTQPFTDARVEATCAQPFYPYAFQLGPAGETAVHTPSVMLDDEAEDSALAATEAIQPSEEAAGEDVSAPEADSSDSTVDAASAGAPTIGKDSLSFAGV